VYLLLNIVTPVEANKVHEQVGRQLGYLAGHGVVGLASERRRCLFNLLGVGLRFFWFRFTTKRFHRNGVVCVPPERRRCLVM